ncbi:MAG TPA: alpha/beta hydrolase [Anaerolineales bacterium]|nr:alpha/beta hydrolase [Anaerolineales bacterium]
MNSFDLHNTGQPLHFLHANGYPPECYRPFLERLQAEYHVFGMLLRPLWPGSNPNEIQDWQPFSDDLLQFLASSAPTASLSPTGMISADTQPAPVIGVGHSIGAIVTLRAALRDPSKFRALILLDPVLVVPSRILLWRLFRAIGLGNQVHPNISAALKRRRTFDNLDLVFRGYRSRRVFRYMSDENLRIYIAGITRKAEQGYELAYSPEWEARIYFTSLCDFDIWRDLSRLQVPSLFIRGAETDTFLEQAAKFVKRKQPRAWVETLDRSTHLLPLERPQEVFERMQDFLKTLESATPRRGVLANTRGASSSTPN